MARAHMPIFTASCGRTRMIAGPPVISGRVLSVPAPVNVLILWGGCALR
jgi:hypothetical protein